MAEFTLYCFAQSGNAYKVALMLELTRQDWQPRFVDFFNGETRSHAYRADINEMGEVPVLEHKGMRLSQSGVILDYLVSLTGRFGWASEEDRREVWRWILWDNHKLTNFTATRRFLVRFAKTGETPVTDFLLGRMKAAYGVLDKHLAGREWVATAAPSIADLSLCGYLYYDGELGLELSEFPNVQAWLTRLKALPGWRHPYDLMPGHPLPGT